MRIMAIDYGDAHTGVAISDPTGLLAGCTATIDAYTPEKVIAGLAPLIAQYGVERLVLGCPKNMDGSEGPRAEKSRAFKALLEQETGLPVVLWDERRTTIDAHHILYHAGKNAKKTQKMRRRRGRIPNSGGLPHAAAQRRRLNRARRPLQKAAACYTMGHTRFLKFNERRKRA